MGFRLGFWVRWILSFKLTGNVLSELLYFLTVMGFLCGWVFF